MFLSVLFSGFWSSKLAMEFENLEKWKFIVSWRFKEQNIYRDAIHPTGKIGTYISRENIL